MGRNCMIRKLKGFWKVLRLENPGVTSLFKMIWNASDVLPFFWIASTKEAKEYIRRYKICVRCPIFDKKYRRCRPFVASTKGCGCYVPFSNIIYDKCWGRNYYGSPFGWGSSDKKSRIKRLYRGGKNNF